MCIQRMEEQSAVEKSRAKHDTLEESKAKEVEQSRMEEKSEVEYSRESATMCFSFLRTVLFLEPLPNKLQAQHSEHIKRQTAYVNSTARNSGKSHIEQRNTKFTSECCI